MPCLVGLSLILSLNGTTNSAISFRHYGLLLQTSHNIAKSAEHMLGPFMAGCHRIRQFAREHHLNDRPHALLWLAKCYAIPTSTYACQIWGTRFMKQGSEFDSPLQTAHLTLWTIFWLAKTSDNPISLTTWLAVNP